jgi:HlyD family secretion protein
VRSIEVHPGDTVHAGEILARLDPTFATADLGQLAAQVSNYQAQVLRMQAEMEDRPFAYGGQDPNMALQAAIYAQRHAEFEFKMENYRQKADSLSATIAKARADIATYTERLSYARDVEGMRKELERLSVGSKLNTRSAQDSRAQVQGSLDNAQQQASANQRDLAALIAERNGYMQSWHAEIADKLADTLSKLSDARESLTKAQLRRQLVELRAQRDGTVLSISKVSVGSVLNAGQQFITIVPTDAPLEVEANISGADDGHVHVGDPVDIKFETFPYTQYGLAHGVVRIVSPDSFTAQEEQRNPTGAAQVPSGGAAAAGVWYRSRMTLDEIALHGVPEGFRLVPGMPIVADIRIGKQTVLRYMLVKTIPLVTEGLREP